MQNSVTPEIRRVYARLAGFLFLWLIVTGLAGMLITSHVAGAGTFTFAETAKRIAASQHLYRFGIVIGLLEPLSTVLLAFALYVTLERVDRHLAQLAMCFRLGESFIGGAGAIGALVTLHVYDSPQLASALGTAQSQALVSLIGHAGSAASNVSAMFFGAGSTLFYFLFFKSNYMPRILSVLGIFASVVVLLMLFGVTIFPEYAAELLYGWAPMAIAEVATGIWLMVFAVRSGTGRAAAVSAQPGVVA